MRNMCMVGPRGVRVIAECGHYAIPGDLDSETM